jgi:glycosyltransferase involved in cell wall biosynthesis
LLFKAVTNDKAESVPQVNMTLSTNAYPAQQTRTVQDGVSPSSGAQKTSGAPRAAVPLVKAAPAAASTVCVVIPARDEAGSIRRTLAALAEQRDLVGRPLPSDSYEIILLANNCRDETAAVARRMAETYPNVVLHVVEIALPPGEAHVGAARRLAMDEACRRLLRVGRPRGIIATTDADTLVSPTWIAATLREVDLGAEAVGGRILVAVHDHALMATPVRSRFLRNVGYGALANEAAARIDPRPGDPWPCHEQFCGASLAVTVRSYRAVGGLPALSSGEDTALGHALLRADIEIRHAVDVRVQTSGRLDGRTPAGLAALLAGWSGLKTDDRFQLVPSAESVVLRATCRRTLRGLWERRRAGHALCDGELACLADRIGVPDDWLGNTLLSADGPGILLNEVEEQAIWHRAPDLVDVRDAIAALRVWLEPYRRHEARPPALARPAHEPPILLPTLAALEQVQAVGPFAPALAPPTHVA